MEYTNSHRLLLTYIRSVRYVSQTDLIQVFGRIRTHVQGDERQDQDGNDIEQQLDDHINIINKHIVDHGFRIDRRMDECTSELYYIYINAIGNDDISKTYSNYTVNELHCIKQLIDEIIESPQFEFAIGKVNASQKVVATQNKTIREAQAFISNLIDNGWFILNENDRLLLSPRSLGELKDYLIGRYNTYFDDGRIFVCNGCKQIVTLGYLLESENSCYHYKCFDIFQRTNPGDYNKIQIGVELSSLP